MIFKFLYPTWSTDTKRKYMYECLSAGAGSKVSPVVLHEKELQLFAGNYAGNRVISMDQSNLYYQRTGIGQKNKLIPIAANLFELDGAPSGLVETGNIIEAKYGMLYKIHHVMRY